VQEDPFVLEGEFSFPMKEDLERREVAGVSSPNPFMTTSAPNVSQGGAPMQKTPVKEHLEECLGNDAQSFGQNTLMQSPQPTVPIHQFVHTPQRSDASKRSSISKCCNFWGFCIFCNNWEYAASSFDFVGNAPFTDNSIEYVYLSR
jgi:hypothetical protein